MTDGRSSVPSIPSVKSTNLRRCDAAAVESYLEWMDLAPLNEQAMVGERNFTLALHKVISDVVDESHVCEWSDERKCWDVYHDGAMSQVESGVVLDAVREAGYRHWIYVDENQKEWVYLGELPEAEAVTWENTREFLANLLHYGIIRTNLREARAAR